MILFTQNMRKRQGGGETESTGVCQELGMGAAMKGKGEGQKGFFWGLRKAF